MTTNVLALAGGVGSFHRVITLGKTTNLKEAAQHAESLVDILREAVEAWQSLGVRIRHELEENQADTRTIHSFEQFEASERTFALQMKNMGEQLQVLSKSIQKVPDWVMDLYLMIAPGTALEWKHSLGNMENLVGIVALALRQAVEEMQIQAQDVAATSTDHIEEHKTVVDEMYAEMEEPRRLLLMALEQVN